MQGSGHYRSSSARLPRNLMAVRFLPALSNASIASIVSASYNLSCAGSPPEIAERRSTREIVDLDKPAAMDAVDGGFEGVCGVEGRE